MTTLKTVPTALAFGLVLAGLVAGVLPAQANTPSTDALTRLHDSLAPGNSVAPGWLPSPARSLWETGTARPEPDLQRLAVDAPVADTTGGLTTIVG
jgi:hypothetical protein